MPTSTYAGTFIVEADDFPLRAERLIIRDNEIAFDFRYKEEHGAGEELTINGQAARQPEGFYRCNGNGDHSNTIIYVLRAQVQHDGCFVEGFWHEREEGAWKFWGDLSPFEAPSPESD